MLLRAAAAVRAAPATPVRCRLGLSKEELDKYLGAKKRWFCSCSRCPDPRETITATLVSAHACLPAGRPEREKRGGEPSAAHAVFPRRCICRRQLVTNTKKSISKCWQWRGGERGPSGLARWRLWVAEGSQDGAASRWRGQWQWGWGCQTSRPHAMAFVAKFTIAASNRAGGRQAGMGREGAMFSHGRSRLPKGEAVAWVRRQFAEVKVSSVVAKHSFTGLNVGVLRKSVALVGKNTDLVRKSMDLMQMCRAKLWKYCNKSGSCPGCRGLQDLWSVRSPAGQGVGAWP